MTFLIDIGNTTIKWGIIDKKNVVLLGREHYRDTLSHTTILQQWKKLPKPKNILISNVAAPAIGEKINLFAQQCWDMDGIFITEKQSLKGIQSIKTQSILGVDRWLALLTANQVEKQPFAVIGCGTAITLDVCKDHSHLGGLIAPGIELMRLSLEEHTDGCRLKPDQIDDSALMAFNTNGAMRAGSLHMATAFIETTLEKIQQALGLAFKPIITGGDAERLIPRFKNPDRFSYEPALVLKGLALFIND